MEDVSSSPLDFVERTLQIASVVEAMAVDTILAAGKSLVCLLILTRSLLTDNTTSELPKLTTMDERFPLDELSKGKHTYLKNKDASDSDEDDDEEANDPDDEVGEEELSGEEGEEEADPEGDPEANGAGGSDGEDDDDDDDDDDDGDDDEDEDGEDEDEEEEEDVEEEDEEEVPQPPAKKRK